MHGENTFLLQTLLFLNYLVAEKMENLMNIFIIGDSAVGKTTISMAYLENKFTYTQPTIIVNFVNAQRLIDDKIHKMQIWDVPAIAVSLLSHSILSKADAILLVFSVIDRQSYNKVLTKWIPIIKRYCQTPPVILVGNKTDLRWRSNENVTTEMGEQLAFEINAVAYFECSCRYGRTATLERIFETAAQAKYFQKTQDILLISNETLFKVYLVGDAKVGKTAIRHAYLKNSLKNNDSNTMGKVYSASPQLIDGKECELKIVDAVSSESVAYLKQLYFTTNDVIIAVFSVADLYSFKMVKEKWIPEIKKHCSSVPIILVGNKTDLRSRSKENVTSEMGKRLAREINAVAYFESSCREGKRVNIKRIFEEALRAPNFVKAPRFTSKSNETLLIAHLVGDAEAGKTAICHAYLTNTVLKTSSSNIACEVYHGPTHLINDKEYKLKIVESVGSEIFSARKTFYYKKNNVIIVVFSVVDLLSFKSVKKNWIPEIKEHCPTTPVILVGNKTDLREKRKKNITTEMGRQLAHEIYAAAYFECSCRDGRTAVIERIFKEAVQTTHLVKIQRFLMKSNKTLFKVLLVGDAKVGKTSLVKRFQNNQRFDVYGERLDKRMHPDYNFSAFTQLDGEECGWIIWDEMFSVSDMRKCDRVLLDKDRGIDFLILMFSVVDFDSYFSIEKKWIPKLQKLKHYNPKIPIVVVGNKTDLRSNTKQHIPTEVGEQLARTIDAAKYLECSTFNGKEVERVFEETAWVSIRYAEERRKRKSWFKSLFGRS